MSAGTVTVTRKPRERFAVTFSQLGAREFGPWGFAETVRDLRVSALLSGQDARDLVLTAAANGSATVTL